MHTSRYNGFNQIHKGLRTLMFDTIMKVQHADLSDAESSREAIQQVETLLDQMDDHADHEDHYILHPAGKHAPELAQEFESEHVMDLHLSNQLREKIDIYRKAKDKASAGKEIYYALNAFVAFNLQHMNKEEQVLNKTLWEHYTDTDLQNIVRTLQQSIPPEKGAVTMAWIIKGLNDVELREWFQSVQAEAPDFIFNALVAAAEKNLPPHRWKILDGSLKKTNLG